MTATKLICNYFKYLVFSIFNLVLRFTSSVTNNQSNYYLTNRGNFLQTQHADLLWLAVEITQESWSFGMWLFEASLWKIIKASWLFETVQVCFYWLELKQHWISRAVTKTGIWLAGQNTLTHRLQPY